jgi:hypothetical protein
MLRRRTAHVGCTLLIALFVALLPAAGAPADPPDRPTRVMIVVIDQFLPEYVDRFDMANVRGLMNGGVNFERALLGHMAAETVVTHNVLTSGLFPKHMGWSNEVFRDVDHTLGAAPYHVTSSMSCAQFETLLKAQGYPKLDDHLGGKFIAVGQKPTAVCPGGHPADAEDIIVHLGGRVTCPDGHRYRIPDGAHVPTYIKDPLCGRFYVDVTDPYGTTTTSPAWMYPLDGHRFVFDPEDPLGRLGGDVWTAEAAIELMGNEPDWKGMMVSFGSVDKMAHMWGTDDTGPSGVGDDVHEEAHLPFAARTADQQVGRLLAQLEARGIRDETLVVLTTDHAGQTAYRYHGLNPPNAARDGNLNWYYGQDADETYLSPQPDLKPLVDLEPNLDFSYQDGHVAAWLADRSPASLAAGAAAMRRLPDVIAAYVRDGDRYQRTGALGAMSGRERAWWVRYGQELIDTMAAPYGPDVVGLLRDDTSYGVRGDHGGHQEQIQHIPMAFSWPGLKPQGRQERIRAVDIVPTVLELMGIPKQGATPLDGEAYDLVRGRSAE